MERKKSNSSGIDENFILNSIKGKRSFPEVGISEPSLKADPIERNSEVEKTYEELFLCESGITSRSGKGMYIRKEHHDVLTKIVQVIGENKISLFSYVDNVLTHHFETWKAEIVRNYNAKNGSIF